MMPYEKAKWVEWTEPFNSKSDPVYCRVRPDVAISSIKEIAAKNDHVYNDDQDAFEDFVVGHWARIIPKPAPLECTQETK